MSERGSIILSCTAIKVAFIFLLMITAPREPASGFILGQALFWKEARWVAVTGNRDKIELSNRGSTFHSRIVFCWLTNGWGAIQVALGKGPQYDLFVRGWAGSVKPPIMTLYYVWTGQMRLFEKTITVASNTGFPLQDPFHPWSFNKPA